jgi:hypothetical protein
MREQEVRNLWEAYLEVCENQQLDEVRGGGKIDPVSDMPGIGERGARSPKDAGLLMSPVERARARAKALKKRKDPEATKNANRITNRFVKPTDRAVNRALLAATNARSAEKNRLMNSYEYDTFDTVLEYLVAEGYADTNESALVIMANMSEEWRESICEATATPPSKFNIRRGLDANSRRLRRSSDFHAYGQDPDPEERKISTSKGEGGITKNPKKLRKQEAMGENG